MRKPPLNRHPEAAEFERSQGDRRQKNDGPPDGVERRISDTDRRTENNMKFLSCKLGGQRIGINISKVREVLPVQGITPIPKAHSSIEGLLNLRGKIITVINLRKRLEINELSEIKRPMYVIVCDENELFSFLVDEVGEVLEFANSKFIKAPASLDECWRKCCQGVYQLTSGLLIALDVSSILKIDQVKTIKGT